MFLSQDAARQLREANLVSLLSYGLLSRDAASRSEARWQLKPKHHICQEIIEHAAHTLRNPRSQWCYKHEDFMGASGRIASQCHVTTVSEQMLLRWLLRFDLPRR